MLGVARKVADARAGIHLRLPPSGGGGGADDDHYTVERGELARYGGLGGAAHGGGR